MQRAEERRKAKASHKAGKQFHMTHESLENSLREARNQERQKAIEHAVKHFPLALAMVLMDKWGFKGKNLKTVLLQIGDLYDSMSTGYVSAEDVRATILKEEGLDLNKRITSKS